jgi:hypothetical protein
MPHAPVTVRQYLYYASGLGTRGMNEAWPYVKVIKGAALDLV